MKIVEEYEKICLVEKKPDNTAGELKDAFSGRKICVGIWGSYIKL